MRARGRWMGLGALALLLVACGGDPEPSAEVPVSTTESTLEPWELPPPEESVGEWADLVDVSMGEGRPDGEPGGEFSFDDVVERSAVLSIDPCTLLDLDAFSELVGAAVKGPIVLENGAGCGATDERDTVRVALMAVPRGPEYRYLSEADRARSAVVDEPAPGWWLTGAPVPSSDQLVVELDEGSDLVVEVSFRGPADEATRRDLAVEIAWEAVVRLPLGEPIGSFEEDQP